MSQEQTDHRRHHNDRRDHSCDDLFGMGLFRRDRNEFQRIMFRIPGDVFDGVGHLGCGIRGVADGRYTEQRNGGWRVHDAAQIRQRHGFGSVRSTGNARDFSGGSRSGQNGRISGARIGFVFAVGGDNSSSRGKWLFDDGFRLGEAQRRNIPEGIDDIMGAASNMPSTGLESCSSFPMYPQFRICISTIGCKLAGL